MAEIKYIKRKSNMKLHILVELKKFHVAGMAIFPFVFIKKGIRDRKRTINHESIHIRQELELLVIPFYLLYLFFYLKNLTFGKMSHRDAYRNIPFEDEAYDNDNDMEYIKKRKPFAWFKYC